MKLATTFGTHTPYTFTPKGRANKKHVNSFRLGLFVFCVVQTSWTWYGQVFGLLSSIESRLAGRKRWPGGIRGQIDLPKMALNGFFFVEQNIRKGFFKGISRPMQTNPRWWNSTSEVDRSQFEYIIYYVHIIILENIDYKGYTVHVNFEGYSIVFWATGMHRSQPRKNIQQTHQFVAEASASSAEDTFVPLLNNDVVVAVAAAAAVVFAVFTLKSFASLPSRQTGKESIFFSNHIVCLHAALKFQADRCKTPIDWDNVSQTTTTMHPRKECDSNVRYPNSKRPGAKRTDTAQNMPFLLLSDQFKTSPGKAHAKWKQTRRLGVIHTRLWQSG